ncbi:unnamed protein product [Didymodactylos carnosus]|uniref:Uncharacterized protein n=1 Tax=Didymodactylos carnosus TaxID=1234261 RepID=A0A815M1Z2_9BILA|nr:unnamed protein product [Didymodactylos carnosus]CAF1415595.1 unnamed protein product [Didymodactylos carnosus]CAF3727732.1 unnamed protein product [Didymodactylos carnosus]CAF4301672.1 unnamed protein product [Didymodactylos carnosus]
MFEIEESPFTRFMKEQQQETEKEQEQISQTKRLKRNAVPQQHQQSKTKVEKLAEIQMNVRLKLNYDEIKSFIYNELNQIDNNLEIIDDIRLKTLTLFQIFTLILTSKPVDMSQSIERTIYRPNFYIKINDAFGPFNFNYLLDLFDIDYSPRQEEQQFPYVWQTTYDTKVHVKIWDIKPQYERQNSSTTTTTNTNDNETLLGLLKKICRQNAYDDSTAENLLKCLEGKDRNYFV